MIVAIDPGNTTGMATLWSGEWTCDTFVDADMNTATVEMYHLSEIDNASKSVVVIEDQFFCRNIKSFKTLIMSRAMWQYAAEREGFEIVIVHPKTWMSYWKIPSKMSKKDKEEYLIKLASSHGVDTLNEHEASAVLMGKWYERTREERRDNRGQDRGNAETVCGNTVSGNRGRNRTAKRTGSRSNGKGD